MSMSDTKYFEYLKGISKLGVFYRKHILYPKINRKFKGKVLDLGCGLGDFLRYRPNTVGVDVNQDTVNYCLNQGFDVKIMELNRLPFNPSSFDGVLMDNVLEHIEEPALILAEVKRVLVSGGDIVVGVPGRKGYAIDCDHKLFYTKEMLVATMHNAGFVEENTFSMPLNLDWLDDKVRQYCVYGHFKNK